VTSSDRDHWWRGARGEWYVVAQVALMLLVFLGPGTLAGWPSQPFPLPRASLFAGAALALLGSSLFVAGMLKLGSNLTPLPSPKEQATLVTTGAYGLVRHPIYGGGFLMAFGWALLIQGWLTIAYSVLLFAFLDVKSRREERWLSDKFPGYGEYQRRVHKLIPFVY
jgi:protein-S-isoprenylcysteine O-methyltransferase Ste14